MTNRGDELRVGAVALFALFLVVLAILWVGGFSLGQDRVIYRVRLGNVNGLEPGSAVRYGGHRVGEIVEARISPDDPTKIELAFAVEADTPMGEGAMARVNQVGLLADPFLDLLPAPSEAPALEPGSFVVGEETRSIGDLIDGLAGLSKRAESSLSRIEDAFDSLLPPLTRVLVAIEDLLAEENRDHMVSLLRQLDELTPELRQVIGRVERTLVELDPLFEEAFGLSGDVRRALPDVVHFTASGAEVFDLLLEHREELAAAMTRLESTLEAVEGLAGNADQLLGDNRQEIEDLLQRLKTTLSYLEVFSEAVARRPSSVVWSGSRDLEVENPPVEEKKD